MSFKMPRLFDYLCEMPLIVRATAVTSLLVLVAALKSFATRPLQDGALAYIYFLCPILWFFWVVCVIYLRRKGCGLFLTAIWIFIDLAILFTLLSFAAANIEQSVGIDITLLIAYFPVIVPIGFLGSFVNLNINSLVGTTLINNVMNVWFEVTLGAAIQSLCIYWTTKLLTRRL